MGVWFWSGLQGFGAEGPATMIGSSRYLTCGPPYSQLSPRTFEIVRGPTGLKAAGHCKIDDAMGSYL